MKFKKTLSLMLSAIMAVSAGTVAANAAVADSGSVGAYSNQNYLETYASKAYSEKNLGSTYSPASTTWKTWSPEATAVKVKLYKTGSDAESGAGVMGTYDMTKNSTTGVWSTTLTGDFKNVYYTYLVTVNGSTNETQDIYSKATGVNGNRSMVVDLDSTDPEGWDSDKHVLFDNAGEAVVWEVHVRDFSVSDTSGVSEENKGKYLAFAEGGTKLNGTESYKTGIDYLVEQGINCVQLQPVYDFQSVDEVAGGSSTNRNWGYDPQNYNVPEGSYSSNAYDGNTRITEFKQMIQALHDRGISVVMDVVYNHTYTTEGSSLSKTVPKYYYRMTSSSAYSNGSGCGNETASEKKMYRKFMTESVRYWAEEYHIDGFRFDLMGLHDYGTMNTIRTELDNLYSDGSGQKILMYGEPWTGGTTPISDGSTKDRLGSLNNRVGMFCDAYRDAIKGDTDGTGKGFVQGNTSANISKIVSGVKGKGYSGAKAPSQTIAYADAHDNLILWDKIVKSNGSSAYTGTNNASYKNQVKEVMTLLLTSQGIPFMTAGSEFGRTKKGDSNSYKSSDSINAIDWERASKMKELSDYYKGLLQIRTNFTPLHTAGFTTPTFNSSSGDVVGYTYTNSKSGEWTKLCVLVNGGSKAWTISNIGSGTWTVVANGTSAGLKSLGTVTSGSYSVPAKGSVVLCQGFSNLNVKEEFGSLTINHVDTDGKMIKTQTSTYAAGSTYRALPDSTILFDYDLVKTEGTTTGTVEAGGSYTVTFTYKKASDSGYVIANYVDESGTALKDPQKLHLRGGTAYEIPAASIMGYQLDTDKYPAKTKGVFAGGDVVLNFVYKPLSYTSSTVHYYNSNGWSNVRLYAYTDDGTEPNGAWAAATLMTNDSSMGAKWLVGTVKAPVAYVMFHPSVGTSQEPGQGETGYLAAGEIWVQNKAVTFNSTVITSHIDLATGKKISEDVVDSKTKITDSATYTTSALSGRTDVITPANASDNYAAGVTNVVYLYGDTDDPITTTSPVTTTEPDTTQPTTTPGKKILIGDLNLDTIITVQDATIVQKHIAKMNGAIITDPDLTIAADTDNDNAISVKDVTNIQKYVAHMSQHGNVGSYTGGGSEPSTTAPVITTDPVTEPKTEPETEPTTQQDDVSEGAVYLDASEINTGEEVWYAYTWPNGGDGQFIAGTVSGSGVAFEGLESGANLIFVRMNASHPEIPRWNTDTDPDDNKPVWNQTEDLTVQSGGTYVITGWGSGWGANLEGKWT